MVYNFIKLLREIQDMEDIIDIIKNSKSLNISKSEIEKREIFISSTKERIKVNLINKTEFEIRL
jgi:hypothetical protein